MTSNIDVRQFMESKQSQLDRAELNKQLSMVFRPEFVNRIDEIILFNQLNLEAIKKIALIQLENVEQRLKDQEYQIQIQKDRLDPLLQKLDYRHFGARPLRRMIEEKVENPIAQDIISGKIKKGSPVSWKLS